ncbi:MAG: RNA polymerase sigma factor [FCB group bacterium]|nr:RNA polymerase sigma factor [FCB group bacterium]
MKADRFTSLLKPHLDDALNYCRALCAQQSAHDAEDVLQNALIKAYKNFSKLEKQSSFRSWLFKIITNSFLNANRSSFWKKFLPMSSIQNGGDFPEIYTEGPDLNMSMRYALSRLSFKERVAILLYEVGGFSVGEIAAFQNEKSDSAVKSRLSRTRKKLKVYLTEPDDSKKNYPFLTSTEMMGDLQYETIQLAEKVDVNQ